jgi:hypothetical protein
MPNLPVTERTRVRRHPERGSLELALMYEILDEAYLCHVAFVHEGQPVVLPMAYARAGDRIYLHGSSKNHMLNVLAGGAPACIEVTLLDGLRSLTVQALDELPQCGGLRSGREGNRARAQARGAGCAL